MREQVYLGLFEKCRKYLEEWNITNLEDNSKWSWRKIIKQRIKQKNLNDLIKWSKGYKKVHTKEIKKRPADMSPFLKKINLTESQVLFRKSCSLHYTLWMNWKKKYQDENLDCVDCLELEPQVLNPDTQDALLSTVCLRNNDLKQGRDPNNLQQKAHFYMDVIERCNKNAKKECISFLN